MKMSFISDHNAHNYADWMSEELSTGTTTMAAEFDGGVIIGVDSRTTMGSYVENRITDKINKITDHIYTCRSGSAADTQAIVDVVRYKLDMLKMELDEQVAVKVAANDFRQLSYTYRDSLSAGFICAGWDRKLGGQVYSIPIGGMIARQPCTIGGSGSTYIYGYVDSNYKLGMTLEECIAFVVKGVAHAMFRDSSSGGIVRIGIITEKGMERRTIIEVPKFLEK